MQQCPSCDSTLTKSGKVHERPVGTTVAAGNMVGPEDTTIAAGNNASNGRFVGTTAATMYAYQVVGRRAP